MGIKDELLEHSRYTWVRTRERIADLGDDEYRWSPVANAWSVRMLPTGRTIVDGNFWPPTPAPFTTVAWRMHHLLGIYGSERNGRWLGVDLELPITEWWAAAPTAAGALAALDEATAYWHGLLEALTDERLWHLIGPQGGPYADSTLVAFVLHQLDEAIHHGAEIGVIRDLHAAMGPGAAEEATAASLIREPNAVDRAADLGRWDLVLELVELGADVRSSGRTALHQAAAVGELDLVRLLVERGADLEAIDPDFKITPLGWAQFFQRADVVDYLSAR